MRIYSELEQFLDEAGKKDPKIRELLPHFRRAAFWAKQLKPDADEAFLVAALCHDIDKIEDLDKMRKKMSESSQGATDRDIVRSHEEKSARVLAVKLRNMGADEAFIERASNLVSRHEEGGSPEQDIIKDADSISFLENNLKHFINTILPLLGEEKVKSKFDYMYDRITTEKAKEIAEPMYKKGPKRTRGGKMKIVGAGLGLLPEQEKRLGQLGELVLLRENAQSKEEALKIFKEADIICADNWAIDEVLYDLKDKFISLPFVGVGWLDLDKLAKNNIKVSNAPGCNKMAVSEWIMAMLLILSRKLTKYIGIKEVPASEVMEDIPGLADNIITVLGEGNIGSRVGKLCEAFGMEVSFYIRNNNLAETVKDADFVVNCLAHNKDTEGLLDNHFFESLKDGVFFISITDTEIYNKEALFNALDSGKIAGAAIDPAGVGIFDAKGEFYQELLTHPKVITTPHIAFHTKNTVRVANDIMIGNVEAFIKSKPQNLVS